MAITGGRGGCWARTDRFYDRPLFAVTEIQGFSTHDQLCATPHDAIALDLLDDLHEHASDAEYVTVMGASKKSRQITVVGDAVDGSSSVDDSFHAR